MQHLTNVYLGDASKNYCMANTFSMKKAVQADLIDPLDTQYARTFTSKYTQTIYCYSPNFHLIVKAESEQISQ